MRRHGDVCINKRSPRKKRPKTFKSEEAANAWAKQMNISNYVLINLKSPESKQKKIFVRKV